MASGTIKTPPRVMVTNVNFDAVSLGAGITGSVTKSFSIPSGYTPLTALAGYTAQGTIISNVYLSDITSSTAVAHATIFNQKSSTVTNEVGTVRVFLVKGM